MTGNDSDFGRLRLESESIHELTILTLTPVRVAIGIMFGSCW